MAHSYDEGSDGHDVVEFSPDSFLWQQVEEKIEQSIAEYSQDLWHRLQQDASLQSLHQGLEREWQSQRQQLENRQAKLLKDLEGQIHQRLRPIIKRLEQELQYSYNLRERIRSVLSQFESLIKNRTQKAWLRIDALVKKQQDSWQRQNRQLSTRLQHWSEKWTEEEEQQRQLLDRSRTFSQQLSKNIELYHQQIQEPKQALLLEGKKIVGSEIRQLVKQFRQLGIGQEERIKAGVSRLLEKWQKLVDESNRAQQHYARVLLAASQDLKNQRSRFLSLKSLQEKEADRLVGVRDQLFAHMEGVNDQLQAQLSELRAATDQGLQQIEQLLVERLQLVDQQLRAAETDDLARLNALTSAMEEKMAQLQQELEQQLDLQQKDVAALIEQKGQQLSHEVEQQFDHRMGQLQRRLHQRGETLESEQRQLQGELQSRLQKECLQQLDEHREYLRSEFGQLEQDCQEKMEQCNLLLQGAEQGFLKDKENLVSKYAMDYNELKSWFEHATKQLKTSVEGAREKFNAGYGDLLDRQRRQQEELDDFCQRLRTRSEAVGGEVAEKLKALDQQLEDRFAGFSQHLDDELLRFNDKLQRCSREVSAGLRAEQKELQSRIREVQERVEQQRKGLVQQVGDSAALLEQQMSDIERRQQDYLGNHVLLERAEQMRQELLDGIDYLRKEGDLVGRIRLQVNDVKEDLGRSNRLSEEIASRLKSLQQKEVDLNQVEARLQQVFKLGESWEQRWQVMKEGQHQMEEFEHRFHGLEALHQRATDLVHGLQEQSEGLQQERRNVEQQKVLVREVEEKISDLRRRIVPLESNFRRLNALENSIGQQQTAVEALAVRAESLQATLDGIDQRMEKVYQAKDFIGRTETRIEELGQQLKGRLQALEQVATEPKGGEGKAPDADTRNTVIQLFHKGWTKKEIARATRLSVGAIELILELAPRK